MDTFLDTLFPPPESVPAQTTTASSIYPAPPKNHTLTQAPTPPPSTKTLAAITPTQEHTRLSELLLQSLLRLDAIPTDGSWEHARAERKGAVREVQGLLDRLDGGWAEGRVRAVGGEVNGDRSVGTSAGLER